MLAVPQSHGRLYTSRLFFFIGSDVAVGVPAKQTPLQLPGMLKQVQAVEINILSDVFGHVHTEQQRTMRHNFIVDPVEVEHSRFEAQSAATILPRRAHFVSVVVDREGNTFVSSDKLYTARIHYSLRNLVPNDSVLHALVFEVHNCTRPVLGLFDASLVGGKCLSKHTCLQRHAILHQAFKSSPKCTHIRMHWVGHERVLVHDLQYKRVPADFDIDCAVRLSDALVRDMKIARLVPKEPLMVLVPTLSSAKMIETIARKRAKLSGTS
jgi:hypothetical protein